MLTVVVGRPTTSSERLGTRGVFLRYFEKVRQGDLKRRGQPVQYINRRVLFFPFQAANVGPIDAGIIGKPLLRQASPDPYSAQIPGYQCSPVHAPSRALQGLLNHWLYPVNFD
jgi:hypothetical protein